MADRIRNRNEPDTGVRLLAVLVVVSLLLTTLWFRESDAGPLHRVRIAFSAATSPVGSAGTWVFTPLRTVSRFVSNLNVDRGQLATLRDQNTELRARVMQLEEAALEAERLRELVGIKDALEMESIGARIIERSTDNWSRTIVIDKGTNDGISVGMAVVSGDGLVGQTVEVGPYSSKVRLIQDDRSGVAALLQTTRADGIVAGSVDGDLMLEFISKEESVTVGDVVITSGMGGVFPKGIVIGEVSKVDDRASGVYRTVHVEPSSHIETLEEVLVIVGSVRSEGDAR